MSIYQPICPSYKWLFSPQKVKLWPLTSKRTSCRQLHVSLSTVHSADINSLMITCYHVLTDLKQWNDLFELTRGLECSVFNFIFYKKSPNLKRETYSWRQLVCFDVMGHNYVIMTKFLVHRQTIVTYFRGPFILALFAVVCNVLLLGYCN